MKLFDAHCHLQDERIGNDVDAIIERARTAGVDRMLCCGSSENDWDAVLELAEKYQFVIPALGIHPWYVDGRSKQWLQRLSYCIEKNPHIAIGEIGLDHVISPRNDKEQFTILQQQLTLAREYNRSTSVHCRKAWGSLMNFLRQNPSYGVNMVIHSYSGPVELIDELYDYGIYFSFSGSVTYERNKRGREALKKVPADRLLIETDSPDILPCNCSGTNEPAHLQQIVQTVAAIRGTNAESIAELTYKNGSRLFSG